MGILERILDVISRPNYAMAEGSRRVGEATREGQPAHRVLDDFIKGFGGGISGKDKTTYSDVLRESGMENTPLRGALGVGMDIALDPSTYIGVGALGKAAKPVAKEAIKRKLGGGLTEDVGRTVKSATKPEIPKPLIDMEAHQIAKAVPERGDPEKVAQVPEDIRRAISDWMGSPEAVSGSGLSKLRHLASSGQNIDDPLYRGVRGSWPDWSRGPKIEFENLKPGDEFKADIASWTTEPEVASRFGDITLEIPPPQRFSQHLPERGPRALSLGRHGEQERVLGGRFKVKDVQEDLPRAVRRHQEINLGDVDLEKGIAYHHGKPAWRRLESGAWEQTPEYAGMSTRKIAEPGKRIILEQLKEAIERRMPPQGLPIAQDPTKELLDLFEQMGIGGKTMWKNKPL